MKKTVIALAFAAALPAFAGTVTAPAGSLTRAEVHAQAVEAVRLGQVSYGEKDFVPAATAGSKLTRAQVHANAVEAVRLGQVQSGEHYEPVVADVVSVKTRDQVKSELAAFMKSPEYAAQNAETHI